MSLHGGAAMTSYTTSMHSRAVSQPSTLSATSHSPPLTSSSSTTTSIAIAPRTFYQRSHSFESRCRMAAQMRAQYVGYVPIVFEPVAQCHSARSHSSTASTSRTGRERSRGEKEGNQPFSSPASSNALTTNEAENSSSNHANDTAYLRQAATKATQLWQQWRSSLSGNTTSSTSNSAPEVYERENNTTTTTTDELNRVTSSPAGRGGNNNTHAGPSSSANPPSSSVTSTMMMGRRHECGRQVTQEDRHSPLRPQAQGAIKFIMPRTKTLSEVILTLRDRLTLDPYQAVFLSVGDGDVLAPGSSRLGELYDRFHNPDGFLYISYALENTFG